MAPSGQTHPQKKRPKTRVNITIPMTGSNVPVSVRREVRRISGSNRKNGFTVAEKGSSERRNSRTNSDRNTACEPMRVIFSVFHLFGLFGFSGMSRYGQLVFAGCRRVRYPSILPIPFLTASSRYPTVSGETPNSFAASASALTTLGEAMIVSSRRR